jgi:hypothetical protein
VISKGVGGQESPTPGRGHSQSRLAEGHCLAAASVRDSGRADLDELGYGSERTCDGGRGRATLLLRDGDAELIDPTADVAAIALRPPARVLLVVSVEAALCRI